MTVGSDFKCRAARVLTLGVLVQALCLPLAATAGGSAAVPDAARAVAVTDATGRRIVLTAPARRVVSLAPHATELVADVGAVSALVAVSAFSDYPESARQLPSVGGAGGVDIERIAALHPDLVVAWTSGNRAREVAALEALGIAVYRSDPHSLEGIATDLENLGTLLGRAAAGTAAAEALRARAADLQRTYGGRPRVRVFYQVWDRPLMTVGAPQLITAVIRLCGGRNLFDDVATLTATVDRETVIARDPEVIVVASERGAASPELASWAAWPGVAAVRNRHLVALPTALITRATPRLLDGAEALCEAIDSARRERAAAVNPASTPSR